MLWIVNTTIPLFYLVMVGVEAADQLAPVGLLLLLELGPAGGGQQQGQEGRGSPAAPHHWCGRVGGALAPAGLVRQDTTPAPHALPSSTTSRPATRRVVSTRPHLSLPEEGN